MGYGGGELDLVGEGPQEKNERRFPDTFSLHFSRNGTKVLEKQHLSADVKRGSSNLLSFFSCCFLVRFNFMILLREFTNG